IYPLIAEKMPEAVLEITGKTEGVNLEGIKDRPGIRLTGYVDDIREELAKAAVCVVPLREGGGSRLKILEAMAAGVPVVSTSVGAEGIEVTRGKNILIADTPKDFAEAVISLTNNDTLADNLAKAAKEFVSTNYSRKRLGDGFAGIIKSVTGVQK
ncbi:MAG: glycosyltransferase, partial [Abditibacteriota bacterium]|nr:glycosyltransferase [Abditibacteriota bacterium]